MPTREMLDADHTTTMLAPSSYNETMMPALRLARTSRVIRRIARVLAAVLAVLLLLVAFAPWQQSVPGKGNVIAYAPGDRQQTLEAPIKGRIVYWNEAVVENSLVKKGETIAEIQDLDEQYIQRLRDQLTNAQQSVFASQQQLAANRAALAATKTLISSYETQLAASQTYRVETLGAADEYIEMARQKVAAEEQKLQEYQAAIPQLQLDFDRHQTLYDEGNIAGSKFQFVERKFKEAKAKVAQAESYVAAAKNELKGKMREREAKAQEADVKIADVEAKLRKNNSDIEKLNSDVAKVEQELNKAKSEVLKAENALARQETQTVVAPFDGYVVKIIANQGTKVLKQGDDLCTIVPDTEDRAVQIWLSGNDAPLVVPGKHVRLQFEGWPALQFTGWPSVAKGTFGGEVVSVDAIDDGKGKFRVLVLPSGEEWPSGRFLRQGQRANGWVLLDQVPLWYEIWRNLNAFPPVVDVDDPAPKDDGKKPKPPKLPK